MGKKHMVMLRVSSRDQNIDRQDRCNGEDSHPQGGHLRETGSQAKDFDQAKYRRLLNLLKPGDTLFVKSIDRLGRNYDEIIEQWRTLTKRKDDWTS